MSYVIFTKFKPKDLSSTRKFGNTHSQLRRLKLKTDPFHKRTMLNKFSHRLLNRIKAPPGGIIVLVSDVVPFPHGRTPVHLIRKQIFIFLDQRASRLFEILNIFTLRSGKFLKINIYHFIWCIWFSKCYPKFYLPTRKKRGLDIFSRILKLHFVYFWLLLMYLISFAHCIIVYLFLPLEYFYLGQYWTNYLFAKSSFEKINIFQNIVQFYTKTTAWKTIQNAWEIWICLIFYKPPCTYSFTKFFRMPVFSEILGKLFICERTSLFLKRKSYKTRNL